MDISVQDIIDVTGGIPSSGPFDQVITSVIIDSRRAGSGSLFVAFTGERTDGHKYLAECAQRGAVAALVEQEVEPVPGMVTIQVANTQESLQQLAAWQRSRFRDLSVIGITGSSGKTTTKELVAGVVSRKFSVLKTRGNHNNEIGLPLTMFEILPRHEIAVLEMGMSARGEISELSRIASPGMGIITNIGEAHIEHLGSVEEIMHAKFELAENLASPGILILNGDDPLQRRRVARGLPGVKRIVFCGFEKSNDVRAIDVVTHTGGSDFRVLYQGRTFDAELKIPGRHNVSNALLAFAAGMELGLEPGEIIAGLSSVQGEKGRLQAETINCMTVLDDSYNANPDSTLVALEVLSSYPPQQRRVAFLGDMLELGAIAQEKHQMVGRAAAKNNVQFLVAVGEYAQEIRQGAIEAGMDDDGIHVWQDSDKARSSLAKLKPGDVVLFKGSRGVCMEKLVQTVKDGGLEKC